MMSSRIGIFTITILLFTFCIVQQVSGSTVPGPDIGVVHIESIVYQDTIPIQDRFYYPVS